MILLDCSEYMRNGDYIPNRLAAQRDAANLLVGAKTQSHPESTVGVSAGTQLLLSPTSDIGKILSAVHGLTLRSKDEDEIISAVQVASLALKHRSNKNGSQRIVLFCGTPVNAEKKALQKVGKQLKKNNVAIDIVVLGEIEHNEEKLQEIVNAANGRSEDTGERTCNLVAVPAGTLPSDVLASSPILAGSAAAMAAQYGDVGGSGAGGAFAEFGGIDPNMDPELAMALRVSMEEERARQERVAAAQAQQGESKEDETSGQNAQMSEEEQMLQQALALSMNETGAAVEDHAMEDAGAAMDEDAELQMALQLSMQQDQGGGGQIQDPAFVQQLLGADSQVDQNDPEVQEMLRKSSEKKDEDATDDKNDK